MKLMGGMLLRIFKTSSVALYSVLHSNRMQGNGK